MNDEKIRVLMVGPMGLTGGVANHTRSLKTELEKRKEIKLTLYNCSPEHPIRFIQNARRYLARRPLLAQYLKKNKNRFDIIHTQSSGGMPGFWTAQTVADFKKRNKDIVFVMTFHHSDTKGFVEKHVKEIEPVMQELDHLILVSNHQKDVFKEYFPWFTSITVIPNGYSSDIFRPIPMKSARERLGLPQNIPILLNIGNLKTYKGQIYLIQAMKKIIARHETATAYILGKGPLEAELNKVIKENGLENHVVLAGGGKPKDEIPVWMNACDIFVLPSLYEGNPTVMFEALGVGLPFVGTKVGGMPEIIQNNKLGLLVPPADPDALANAILKALESDWDREYIRKYAKRYDLVNMANKVIEVYENVAEK